MDAEARAELEAQPLRAENKRATAALQETLRQLGYDPGPTDGELGPKTLEAMQAFSLARGLHETGASLQAFSDELTEAFRERR